MMLNIYENDMKTLYATPNPFLLNKIYLNQNEMNFTLGNNSTPQGCTRLETICANEMNRGINHAPGTG